MSNPQQPEIRRSDESPTTKQRTEDAHPTTAPGGSHDKTDSQPTPRESSFAVRAVRAHSRRRRLSRAPTVGLLDGGSRHGRGHSYRCDAGWRWLRSVAWR
jgi:hypothetical protein